MPAGILTNNPQAAIPDVPVQMLTSTYDTYTHYFFAYQMGTAIEIMILAFLIFIFKPYLPFLISRIWTHLPVVGIMNRTRNIAPFGGFSLRNGMYRREWKNTVMYFVKKYLGSYFFMGVPFDIVHLDRGFVQDLQMNKFVVSLSSMGYTRWSILKDAFTFNGLDKTKEDTGKVIQALGFNNYEDAQMALNPSNLSSTSMIYAPKFSNIPLDSLIGFCKNAAPGTLWALIDHWYEFLKPEIEVDKIMEWLPYIALFIGMAIAGAIIMTQIH